MRAKFAFSAVSVAVAAALPLAGCQRLELESFRAPDTGSFFRGATMKATVPAETGPVRPEDLVDAQGQCAAEPMAAVPPQSGQPAADGKGTDPVTIPQNAASSSGIGLGMTECDVLKRAGAPEKFELGTTEGGERKLTLTYTRNMRPGIYSFTAGRLVSIERVAEPPPPKPAKTTKPKPKPKAT